MNVFNSEMHWVTFVFIILEILFFSHQLVFYLQKPGDQKRKYYLILLLLLILYNVCGGLFPDPNILLSIELQNIIAYGTGFIMACFFPFYFYKAFGIDDLIFHAKYGVFFFLIFPFLIFFCVVYPINGDLESAVYVGLLIPLVYAIYLLFSILKGITKKYKGVRTYYDVFLSYVAVFPWAFMPVMAYLEVRQLTEVLFTNGGFLVLTLLFLRNMIQEHKKDLEILSLLQNKSEKERFLRNCTNYGLTKREIEVCELAIAGHTYKEIANALFISDRTVNKHMQNIFKKSESKNKVDLLYRIKDLSIS